MNQIRIDDIRIENGTRVLFEYTVTGDWEVCFTSQRVSFIDYFTDISEVPESVLVVPFICNILPAAWVCNAVIEADKVDSDFLDHVEDIKNGYKAMYPMIGFHGKLVADSENVISKHDGGSACFFSGGLDANTTLLRHIEERPALISIWGSDIKVTNEQGWKTASGHIRQTAVKNNVRFYPVKSDFRNVLVEGELDKHIRDTGDRWWHGFQNSIAIISHAAPLAFIEGWDKVYIASSFSADIKGQYTGAGDPGIDNNVRFCGCITVHDGYELNRQQKTEYLVKTCEENNTPVSLRVCWESSDGNNCCNCEKCYRTILGLVAEGADPNDYGFVWDESKIKKCRQDMSDRITIYDYDYYPIQKRMIENKDRIKNAGDYQWFMDLDIASVNGKFIKKIRNSRIARLFGKDE